jgi:hypothetical protein
MKVIMNNVNWTKINLMGLPSIFDIVSQEALNNSLKKGIKTLFDVIFAQLFYKSKEKF